MTDELTCVVVNASELVVGPAGGDQEHGDDRTHTQDSPLEIIEDGGFAAVDGEIVAVGPTETITRDYSLENATYTIDASGKTVIPGFVDPHTHALFAGDRSDEFEAKLQGKSYQDILEEGGGILRTVDATRKASSESLLDSLLTHLDVMLANGTTTVEVKSGYGLECETELRMLEVIAEADDHHPVDVVPTFMGAHAVPTGRDATEYVDDVVERQIPAVENQGVAEFCDVFCEEGAFDVSQSRQVLEAGRDAGLVPKVHAEELSHLGGTELAAEVGAVSADHLLHATDSDINALAAADVVPVLLPGTAFGLGVEYADPAPFFHRNLPVAIATDFNPNCYARRMGFVQTLSCLEMGMAPAQALLAGTHHGALALGRDDGLGTLRVGAPADALVLDGPSYAHVAYNFDTTSIGTVLKGGAVVR